MACQRKNNTFSQTLYAEKIKKYLKHSIRIKVYNLYVVLSYKIDEKQLDSLDKLVFKSANREWLRFIAANRKGQYISKQYDLIISPVANDQVIRTVNDYLSGYFSEDIAIQLLLPQKLKDQFAFKTEKALSLLDFTESKIV